MTKLALAAATFSLVFAGAASAADLSARMPVKAPPPPPPVWTWTGFYVGINGGWIGSNSNTLTNIGTDTGAGGLGTALAVGSIPVAVTGFRNNGGMVGGTAGYNWQVNPNWVVGVEGDIDWVSAKRSFATPLLLVPPAVVPLGTAYSRELDWLATFRGRVGFLAAPSVLLYGTAGGAVGQVKVSNRFICPGCAPPAQTEATTFATNDSTAGGWTAGAGVEWMFAPAWTFKAEYLYVDLGHHSSTIIYTYGPNISTLTSSVKDTYNIARVGVNYKFNWGAPLVARY